MASELVTRGFMCASERAGRARENNETHIKRAVQDDEQENTCLAWLCKAMLDRDLVSLGNIDWLERFQARRNASEDARGQFSPGNREIILASPNGLCCGFAAGFQNHVRETRFMVGRCSREPLPAVPSSNWRWELIVHSMEGRRAENPSCFPAIVWDSAFRQCGCLKFKASR